MTLEPEEVKQLTDKYVDNLPFWYLDALFGGATENSSYRKKTIKYLDLTPQSKIIDIACGTGFNFKIIQSYLQNGGQLIGLDISPRSLEYAKGRIMKYNWNNVELINMNISEYNPQILFDAALCTYAISVIPDYKSAIDRIYNLLKPNGRFAILGMKLSAKIPFKFLNSYMDRYYLRWGINVHRPLINYIKSKSMKLEYYKECHFGFEYILGAIKLEKK